MPTNTRNIIIFLGIAMVFTSIYIFFFRNKTPEANLISVSTNTAIQTEPATLISSGLSSEQQDAIAQNFLSLLLNVKNIKLDDSIFSDKAFNSLRDSTITLTQDGSEGRLNPFAKFGSDNSETQSTIPVSPPGSTTGAH
jgi:hypothetical protein